MTELERMKLAKFKANVGYVTIEEAIALAIEAEEHKRAVGPLDGTFLYMANQQRVFEEYALLLEKEAHE